MSMPPTVGPNVALVLQRLDLIERKIDWLAERVTWLTYSSATPMQESSDSPATTRSSSPAVASNIAADGADEHHAGRRADSRTVRRRTAVVPRTASDQGPTAPTSVPHPQDNFFVRMKFLLIG